jgi:hypothetical protein
MVAAWKGDTLKQVTMRLRTALSGKGTTAVRERSAGGRPKADVGVAFSQDAFEGTIAGRLSEPFCMTTEGAARKGRPFFLRS